MKCCFFLVSVAAVLMVWAADPVVRDVTVSSDSETRLVTVGYALEGASAIVTFSVTTNGVAVDDKAVSRAFGDINRMVKPGEGRSFRWFVGRDFANVSLDPNVLKVQVKAWTADNPPLYMAIDLTATNTVTYYASSNAVPGGVGANVYRTGKMLFRRIPAKGVTWRMGSVSGETGRSKDVEVPHYVTMTNEYYMAVYELTHIQHVKIQGSEPSNFRNVDTYENAAFSGIDYNMYAIPNFRGTTLGAQWPANHEVDENSFVGRLRKHTGLSGIDLPTEAQWEFACRAGSPYPYGDESDTMETVGWDSSNAPRNGSTTRPAVVGLKKPNAWGLYDMHGNVTEACLDWYYEGEAYSDGSPVTEPRGGEKPATAVNLVARGGNVRNAAAACRSASRGKHKYATGEAGYYTNCQGVRLMCAIPVNAVAEGEVAE